MIRPPHTFGSVIRELVQGLSDGTVVLDGEMADRGNHPNLFALPPGGWTDPEWCADQAGNPEEAAARSLSSFGDSCVGALFDDARPAYEGALRLYRKLAVDDPRLYLPRVAETLRHLATIFFFTQRQAEAVMVCEESLQIYRGLARSDPRYLSMVAETLNYLGHLYSSTQRDPEAVQAHDEYLQILRLIQNKGDENAHLA